MEHSPKNMMSGPDRAREALGSYRPLSEADRKALSEIEAMGQAFADKCRAHAKPADCPHVQAAVSHAEDAVHRMVRHIGGRR